MAEEVIIFHCPHCQVRLRVPNSMAGVRGPCPTCARPIVAPQNSTEIVQPLPVAAPLPAPAPPGEGQGQRIRPEPRQLPDRPAYATISPKRSTRDDEFRSKLQLRQSSYEPPGRRIRRVLVPLAFVASAAGLVWFLFSHFLPSPTDAGNLSTPAGNPHPELPEETTVQARMPEMPASHPDMNPSPGSADATQPGLGIAPTEPRSTTAKTERLLQSIEPGVAAYEVLETFLKAKDAASRIPLVEPAVSVEELEATFLRGPLPDVAQTLYDLQRRNVQEGYVDYPCRVCFFTNDKPVEYAVLVRQRGTEPPKVFLPAFLDLAGGRLEAYTRAPNREEPGTFHVILEPVAGCYEDTVPNADRKFTLKLLPSTLGKETARAYCANASRFRERIESPDSSVRWGTRIHATVTVQWNHREDPALPYLELIDINSTGWNP